MEFAFWLAVIDGILNWYIGKSNDFVLITLLLCIGFNKILDGKDEMIKFTKVKEKICNK